MPNFLGLSAGFSVTSDAPSKGQATGFTGSNQGMGKQAFLQEKGTRVTRKLVHASRVVQPGKIFLCGLFELLKGIRNNFHHVRMNVGARSDIYWWLVSQPWNSVSLIREFGKEGVDHDVVTDASGQFGCGGLWKNRWFQVQWNPEYQITKDPLPQDSIMLCKLLPVVIAAAIWGQEWRNSVVRVCCDNKGAIVPINSGYSKVQGILYLLRCLFFF